MACLGPYKTFTWQRQDSNWEIRRIQPRRSPDSQLCLLVITPADESCLGQFLALSNSLPHIFALRCFFQPGQMAAVRERWVFRWHGEIVSFKLFLNVCKSPALELSSPSPPSWLIFRTSDRDREDLTHIRHHGYFGPQTKSC